MLPYQSAIERGRRYRGAFMSGAAVIEKLDRIKGLVVEARAVY